MPFTSAGNGTTHALYEPGATSLNFAGSPLRMITHCDALGPDAAIERPRSVAVFATITPDDMNTLATPIGPPPFVTALTSTVMLPGSTVRSIETSLPAGTV